MEQSTDESTAGPTGGGDSNVGKWEGLYGGLAADHVLYGDNTTYQLAGDWIGDLSPVEDWGCGLANMRHFVRGEYRPLDGSRSAVPDVTIVDLATYRSEVPAITMRHVLEHDYRWAAILDNALASFTVRMALILFTPMVDETTEIGYTKEIGVPDLSFSFDDILRPVAELGISVRHETMRTGTWYGEETIFYLEKP